MKGRSATNLIIKTLNLTISLAMVFSSFPLVGLAAVSPTNVITYQGRLLDATGAEVVDASVSMSFAFYNALSGGTCLWSNNSTTCASVVERTVTLTNALFTENLGDTTIGIPYAAIADTVFANNASVYLEATINGETLTPRKRLSATAYALNSQTLDGLDSTDFLSASGDTGTGTFGFTGDLNVTLSDGSTASITDDGSGTAPILALTGTSLTADADILNISLTQSSGAGSGADNIGLDVLLTGNDTDGDLFGLVITGASTANAGAGTYEAGIKIFNLEDTTDSMPDGIIIDATSSGAITDAIDVSDAEITNALNVGANDIIGTTGLINYSNFDVAANGEIITADDLHVNGDNIDADGDLTVTGATGLTFIASANDATLDAVTSLSIDVTGATGASNISVVANADAEDLTIETTGSEGDVILSTADDIILDADGAAGNIITLDAYDAGTNTSGALAMYFGSSDFVVTGSGASADFTLDADLFSIDGTGASNVSVTGGLNEDFTISQIGAADASLILSSTGTGADALQITTTAGGIDILNGGAAGGEDIDISSTLASINLTAGESAVDSIVISSTIGGIDITAAGAAAGEDIDISSTGSSVNISASEAVANAITLNASNAAGGIDVDFGSGNMVVTGTGASADFTLDADLFSIDGTGTSNVSVNGGVGEDFTISQIGAADTSLILSSTGTNVDALQISTSAGGIDITVAGAAAGEDLDLTSNSSINLTATEAVSNAINIFANAEGGAVVIRGGDNADASTADGNDVFIGAEDDVIIDANDDLTFNIGDDYNLTSLDLILTGTETTDINATNEGITIDATDSDADGGGTITLTGNDGITATATTGALALNAAAANMTLDAVTSLSIDVTGATGASNISVVANADAEDLTIETTGSEGDVILSTADDIMLDADGAAGNIITLDAYDAGTNTSGALAMYFGSGDFVVTGSGASADFTLDADLISIDGTGTSNFSVTGGVGEDFTISQIGAADASLILSSTGTGVDALQITTTAGGIDILNSGAAGGEDLDITSTSASINLTAGESAIDSIVISSTIGGIDITAAGAAAGEDIDILATGSSINLTSTEGVADGLVFTSTNGGIDMTTTGAAAGEDIDVTSSASLNLIGQEAAANAIVIDASTDAGGGIDIDFGTGDMVIVGNTAGADFTLDSDLFSIDGTGTSNVSVNGGAGEDFTISQIGAAAASLILSSTGTGANALQITTTAGGIDILNGGAAGGEDLDISSTLASINLTAGESAIDSIVISSTIGGIDITAAGAAAGEDIDISSTGSSVNISASEATADAITLNSSAGGLTIDSVTALSVDVTGATGASNISVVANADAEDLTIETTGSEGDVILRTADDIMLDADGAAGNIITLDAYDDATNQTGGISMYFGSSDFVLSSGGIASGDFTLDADLISIDGTGTSNISVTGGVGEDFTISQIGAADASLILSSTGTGADALQLTTTAGGIDILNGGAAGGEDLDLSSTSASINLTAGEAAADAIKINASNAAGGIDVDFGTGDMILTGTGVNADFTLDADLFSIDGTGTSNISVNGGIGEDFTISQIGAADASLVLSSTGTGADALQITTTAGGIDILNGGAAGEDIDISSTNASINLTAGETTADAIVISAPTGGIDITGAGIVDISATTFGVNITGQTDVMLTSTAGDVNITTTTPTGDDIVLTSSDDIMLDADGAPGNIITLDAYDAGTNTAGALAAYFGSGDFTITGTGASADFTLDADLISIDGTGASNFTVTGLAGEDLSFINNGGSLILTATEQVTDAIVIQATAALGGIDITSNADLDITTTGTPGEDISITNTGGSILLTATEAATDAIVIQATTILGGIDIIASEDIDITNTGGPGNDISITNTGGSVNISATEVALDAINVDSTGGIDIDSGDDIAIDLAGAAGEDILVTNTGGSISLTSTEGVADAIKLNASDTAGGIDVDFGTTDMIITGTGASADFTLDADLLSIDGTGLSNVTVTSNASNEDFTVALAGATDSSLILSSTGTGVDALQITTTAGGIDITNGGAAGGEDIDIFSTLASLNLTAGEGAADAIVLNASNPAGGIDVDFGTGDMILTGNGVGAELTINADTNLNNVLNIPDNIQIILGTDDDVTIGWVEATKDLLFDNTYTTGSTLIQLGTDTTATDFQILNNSSTPLFTVDGLGTLDLATAVVTGDISTIGYPAAKTPTGDVRGMVMDLQTNITGDENVDLTGFEMLLPAITSVTADTTNYNGYVVNAPGALVQNTLVGTLKWNGFRVNLPNITQTTGSVTAKGFDAVNGSVTTAGTMVGVHVTTGAITNPSSGYQYGVKVVPSVGAAAGTLIGVGIETIAPGAGTEIGLNIGAGWDDAINVASGKFIVEVSGRAAVNLGGAATLFGICHDGADVDAGTDTTRELVSCSAGPGDYAEWYETDGTVAPGDIVTSSGSTMTYNAMIVDPFTGIISTGTTSRTLPVLEKASATNTAGFLAVASSSPIQTIGAELKNSASHPVPIALNGRVPVNVTNEGGSISIGDPITASSTSGYGMKATRAGMIIGYSLENFSAASGQIMVLVSPEWYAGNVLTSDGSATLVSDTLVMNSLSNASSTTAGVASQIFALRGSGWDGAAAIDLDMKIQTQVTDSSDYRLSIKNTTDTEVAYISNEGTMMLAGDLIVTGELYPSDRGAAQTSKYIYYDGSTGAGGDMMRTNAAGWSTGSYDFAEMFPSTDVLEAGDVVIFTQNEESVGRSTETYSKKIAGIISTRPGFLAGENKAGQFPVALAGRVPTKVNLEGGAIAVGDPLTTSSTSGYAMKASEAGQIVGYALEPYTGSGNGKITVFVNVGYFNGTATTSAPGVSNTASLLATGASTNFTTLNIEGGIYMGGNDILNIGRLVGLADIWSIEEDGTIKTQGTIKTVITSYQNEKVETTALTSTGGVFVTLVGTTELQSGLAVVNFEEVDPLFNDVIATSAPIRVIVTPSGPVSLYVDEKTQNGFVIKQIGGSDSGISVDWMVTAYRKDYEPKEDEPLDSEASLGISEGDDGIVETTPEVTEPAVVEAPPVEEPETIEEIITETTEPVSEPATETVADVPAESPTQTSDPTVEAEGGVTTEPTSTDSASIDSSAQMGG